VPPAISVLIEDSRFEKLAESSPVHSISHPLKVVHPPKAKAGHTHAGHTPFSSCDFYLSVFMQVKLLLESVIGSSTSLMAQSGSEFITSS